MNKWVLNFSCNDQPGIVHAVTGGIIAAQGNILELHQFASDDTDRFFMRILFESPLPQEALTQVMTGIAATMQADCRLESAERPMRVLVLASKTDHCLQALLSRMTQGHLSIEVPLVMANHPDLEPVARYHGVDFVHQSVSAETKADFEDAVRAAIREHDVELVVLARYMQIVSPELCEELAGRAINIHHSFLPGFKGANPYRQAHARGVKLIGATAHFVTSDLDEGPIIEQNVVRVDHTQTPAQLMRIGQDEESRTLVEAVRLFAERRVFLDGRRTVIFR